MVYRVYPRSTLTRQILHESVYSGDKTTLALFSTSGSVMAPSSRILTKLNADAQLTPPNQTISKTFLSSMGLRTMSLSRTLSSESATDKAKNPTFFAPSPGSVRSTSPSTCNIFGYEKKKTKNHARCPRCSYRFGFRRAG